MTLLLLAARQADLEAVASAVSEPAGEGPIWLIGMRPSSWSTVEPLTLGLAGVHDLLDAADAHGPAFRRSLRGAGPARRFALHVRHDPWIRSLIEGGTVSVVALDDVAERAGAWIADMARRPSPAAPKPTRRRWLGRPRRTPVTSAEQARSLAEAGDHDAAAAAARRVAAILTDPRERADLLGDITSAALVTGAGAELLVEAVSAELTVADAHLARGELDDAATSYGEALRTAFPPSIHFDGLRSPLAADPAAFTAPLATSTTARAVWAPQHPDRRPRPRPADRDTRLLFALRGTESFATLVEEHAAGLPGLDVRSVRVPKLGGLARFVDSTADFAADVLTGGGRIASGVGDLLGEQLAWADTVWVEWCSQLAALVSRPDPGNTRVIVRLHAYEPFTRWPQLVDFSHVDDLVFVSDHVRRFTLATTHGLRDSVTRGRTRIHVLPNAVDLARCSRPKTEDARFTLALIGASKIVKDPRWALEVLRLLRREDPRYRLLLVGGRFQGSAPAVREYAGALAREINDLGAAGAVETIRFTDDVPAVLQRAGAILSSSVRESFHVGLVEGAASGAVPVVRDWPYFPGAARELFPDDWVVSTPVDAARRIIALTANEERWREAGAAASAYVRRTWDWPAVRSAYDDVLRG